MPRYLQILTYHAIGEPKPGIGTPTTVPVDSFIAQMRYLRENGYAVLPIDAVLWDSAHAGGRAVALTFDDGYESHFTVAYPILRELGFPACFFITTDYAGQPWGDSADRGLTWDEARQMQQGHMLFGSHGCSHRPLNTLADTDLEHELASSKETLHQQLGITIDYLSYPHGYHDTRVIHKAQRTGYRAAFSIAGYGSNDLFSIERTIISSTDSLRSFRVKLSPAYALLRRRLGWLNRTAHRLRLHEVAKRILES